MTPFISSTVNTPERDYVADESWDTGNTFEATETKQVYELLNRGYQATQATKAEECHISNSFIVTDRQKQERYYRTARRYQSNSSINSIKPSDSTPICTYKGEVREKRNKDFIVMLTLPNGKKRLMRFPSNLAPTLGLQCGDLVEYTVAKDSKGGLTHWFKKCPPRKATPRQLKKINALLEQALGSGEASKER